MLHAQPKRARLMAAILGVACVCATHDARAKPKAEKRAATVAAPAVSADASDPDRQAEAPHAEPNDTADREAVPAAQVTPATGEPPTEQATSSAVESDNSAAANEKLAALRADVSTLTDDLVEARSRAALLGKTLFKTQVRVKVQNLAAPDPVLVKLVLKLDGAPIFRGDAAALGGEDDERQVFQSFIAPGAHVLSAEVEQRSQQDAAYGYVLHDTYRFQALRDKRSELTLILDDDSDLASEFPDDAEGEYDVRIKLRVRTKALNEP